jgi:predicted GIY-YIG superfamily endonuclease
MKAEILKKGFPAIFDNMALLKDKNYFAKQPSVNSNDKPINFSSLKLKPGIYMITNKVTKKFYIGMSKNLQLRFYNYLNPQRIFLNRSSRIHKAIFKYRYENFSVTILEFCDKNTSAHLRKREDYYIRIFKPQYNIARSSFNLDIKLPNLDFPVKKYEIIPLKIQNLLDNCLDPACLD